MNTQDKDTALAARSCISRHLIAVNSKATEIMSILKNKTSSEEKESDKQEENEEQFQFEEDAEEQEHSVEY
eukprot:Em0012g811a